MARYYVNQPERLPLRYGGSVEKAVQAVARFAVEWTEDILPVLETRPESLDAEVQAIRIGDVFLAANPSELFTSLGLDLRRNWPCEDCSFWDIPTAPSVTCLTPWNSNIAVMPQPGRRNLRTIFPSCCDRVFRWVEGCWPHWRLSVDNFARLARLGATMVEKRNQLQI